MPWLSFTLPTHPAPPRCTLLDHSALGVPLAGRWTDEDGVLTVDTDLPYPLSSGEFILLDALRSLAGPAAFTLRSLLALDDDNRAAVVDAVALLLCRVPRTAATR